MKGVISLVLVLMLMAPLVSAGVGLKTSQESALVPEKTKTCLTYSVYNPFDTDSYMQIKLSEELDDVILSSEAETKFVPAKTYDKDALPIEFCFKTPRVYERDCLVGDFICEQTCTESMKTYEGEVEVIELSEESAKIGGGAGGSATQMSLSSPLRIRVQCTPSDRNYGLVYGLIALIAGILLWINLAQKKKSKKSKKSKIKSKK